MALTESRYETVNKPKSLTRCIGNQIRRPQPWPRTVDSWKFASGTHSTFNDANRFNRLYIYNRVLDSIDAVCWGQLSSYSYGASACDALSNPAIVVEELHGKRYRLGIARLKL